MKEVKLTQGKVALVDDDDFELVSKYKWHVKNNFRNIYATTRTINKKSHLSMHALIIGYKAGLQIDHINHNGLDNRKCNLRHATWAQNQHNSRKHIKSSSVYKGVFFNKNRGMWSASITKNNKNIYLGDFCIEKMAAIAYNIKAKELFGDFSNINDVH